MHVALVRQRYSAHGGAERFIERALDALSEQGVAVTVLAREWTGDRGGVIRCDPFHIGRLWRDWSFAANYRSEEHTSELQSQFQLVCRPLLEKKKNQHTEHCVHCG